MLNYLSTMPQSYMKEWRYSSTILDLGTRWSWVVSFTPRPLYPRTNRPWYPLERRLGGPQSQSGCYGEEKNLGLARIWTPAIQPRSPSLYQLSYADSQSYTVLFKCVFTMQTNVLHCNGQYWKEYSLGWQLVDMILMSLSANSVLYQCLVLALSDRKRIPSSRSLLTPGTYRCGSNFVKEIVTYEI
jgi:hypothetical protein